MSIKCHGDHRFDGSTVSLYFDIGNVIPLWGEITAAIFELGFKITAAFFELGFKITTAVFELGFKITAAVFELGSKIIAAVFELGFKITTAVFELGFIRLNDYAIANTYCKVNIRGITVNMNQQLQFILCYKGQSQGHGF